MNGSLRDRIIAPVVVGIVLLSISWVVWASRTLVVIEVKLERLVVIEAHLNAIDLAYKELLGDGSDHLEPGDVAAR